MSCISFVLFLSLCISGITGYSVTGNKINDPNGKQVLIRGIDRPSFEWNINGEQASSADYALMRGWGANVVRVSLNQDFWLGSSASTYQTNIDNQISWITANGMGVILDLHWNGGGQKNMADRTSITFWSQVAARYKANQWVMFELYNEPHDVSWAQWLSGDGSYAGMQEMYQAVRSAGANNLVVVCGLNWAFDLSGVSNGFAVQGTNIAYATHPYDYPGKQKSDWPAAFGNLAATYPIIMTEFGQYCATNTYVADLLAYCEANGIHWTAWAWYVNGCSFPSIIADWAGTPSAGVGQLVKSYLSGSAPPAPVLPTSAPSNPSIPASNAMTVFSDALASGWQDWSWATAYSLSDSTYVRGGSKSIKFNVQAYGGIYLHTTSPFAVGGYGSLQFYVNGGTSAVSSSSLSVKLYGTSANVIGSSVNFPASVPASQWSLISIPITSFGVSGSSQVSGFVIQSNADASAGTIWIDDISFVPAASTSTPAPTRPPTPAPTTPPTRPPTSAPTQAPTRPPTSAPTQAPTRPPTSAPTQAPTTRPPTAAPTTAPTKAPTSAPSGCGVSSVQITQSAAGSWPGSGGTTVTQYNVQISHTCTGKTLVGLSMTAANWNPVNFWNAVAATSGGTTTITLPSYAAITPSNPFTVGYQNVGGQATFTITSATFQ